MALGRRTACILDITRHMYRDGCVYAKTAPEQLLGGHTVMCRKTSLPANNLNSIELMVLIVVYVSALRSFKIDDPPEFTILQD